MKKKYKEIITCIMLLFCVSENNGADIETGLYDEDTIIKCPICNIWVKYSLQFSDYVTDVMVWCNECGCRLVTNISYEESEKCWNLKNKVIIENDDNRELFENNRYTSEKKDISDESEYKLKNPIYFAISLVKIHKVMNRELIIFDTIREVSQKDIIDFINSNYNISKYKVFYKKEKNSNIFIDFKLGLEINSYNVVDAYKLCPDIDLRHDGISVYLQCIKEDGEKYNVTYWGD